MPKKEAPKPWEVLFVSCELDKSVKEQVKLHDPKFTWTTDAIDRMMSDGYKISMSPDKSHDCIGVYATMTDKTHKHAGLCLSARGQNYLIALKVLAFKHFNMLQEDWTEGVSAKGEWDSMG